MTSNNTERRSPIGLERLVVWKMTKDTEAGTVYEETPHPFVKALITAQDTPSVMEASQDADNQTVDSFSGQMGGELVLGITEANSEDRALLYGEQVKNGTNVTNKDDCACYLCAAYMTKKSNGLVNLYKYPKVKFSPQAENYETLKKGGVTYVQASLKGVYENAISSGDAKYTRYNVDPVKDAELLAAWFTEADYTAPEQTPGN